MPRPRGGRGRVFFKQIRNCLVSFRVQWQVTLRSKDDFAFAILNRPEIDDFVPGRFTETDDAIDFMRWHEDIVSDAPVECRKAIHERNAEFPHEQEDVRYFYPTAYVIREWAIVEGELGYSIPGAWQKGVNVDASVK